MSTNRLSIEPLFSSDQNQQFSREEIFDILSNKRRQCIIHYLKRNQKNGPVATSDLVDYVTAWEADVPIADIPPTRRKRVYNALQQTHLPKLEEAAMIEWNEQQGCITLTPALSKARLYLEFVPNDDIPWSMCYLVLSGVASVLTTVIWYGVPPFGGNTNLSAGVIVLGMFVITGALHRVDARSARIPTDSRFEPPNQ